MSCRPGIGGASFRAKTVPVQSELSSISCVRCTFPSSSHSPLRYGTSLEHFKLSTKGERKSLRLYNHVCFKLSYPRDIKYTRRIERNSNTSLPPPVSRALERTAVLLHSNQRKCMYMYTTYKPPAPFASPSFKSSHHAILFFFKVPQRKIRLRLPVSRAPVLPSCQCQILPNPSQAHDTRIRNSIRNHVRSKTETKTGRHVHTQGR